jgi:hypothetical protein
MGTTPAAPLIIVPSSLEDDWVDIGFGFVGVAD